MRILFCLFFTFLAFTSISQNNFNCILNGRILNSENGEPIEIATIILNKSIGTLSDSKGNFQFKNLKVGEYTYTVSSLGFKESSQKIAITQEKQNLIIRLQPLSIGLNEVVVTATSSALGSSSKINESAIQHIQPKSIDDMLQLLPGGLSKNPNLNKLGQANIREIGSNNNNALGTVVIVDGAPLSNDGNLQTLSSSRTGASSGTTQNGFSDQTTSGKGVDMRAISADNVESMEVIRGIPSAEYGNLTSGVVIVKTKAGVTPLEIKLKADPFSKMVYAGKGLALKKGGAINMGFDWSQSFGDTRKRYLGYDRLTASISYSNQLNIKDKPLTLNIRSAFYSNVNNSKEDPQMLITNDTYTNKSIGGRITLEGDWKLNMPFVTSVGYSFMGSITHQEDKMHEYVASSNGMISYSNQSGISEGLFLPASYYSDYKIDGLPVNFFGLLKANKMLQITNESYTNIKCGIDWRYDVNKGKGLMFDVLLPPQNSNSQSLRPRLLDAIPALNQAGLFIEDKSYLKLNTTYLTLQAGVRMSNLLLDKSQAKQSHIWMTEPRLNIAYELLNSKNNSFLDELSINGGWGLSYKAPTLLYLYPDKVYFDRACLSKKSDADPTATLGVMDTRVLSDLANEKLRAARSQKFEGGLTFRRKKVKGMITFFQEKHSNEFGFFANAYYFDYNRYDIPTGATNLTLQGNDVHYQMADKEDGIAQTQADTLITTYYTPTNKMMTQKKGVEYSLDLGSWKALRTSLILDGAWFYIKRTNTQNYYSMVDDNYGYIKWMPAGSGTIQNRFNTNFRFITHIPAIKLIFSTTVQVVWYESEQNIWNYEGKKQYSQVADDNRFLMNTPLGFYDKAGRYTAWQEEFNNRPEYSRMISKSISTAYDREVYAPWVMFNFRLTKEIGKIMDLSFTANNFTNTTKWHYYKRQTGYKQIYPDLYFGAELRIKINSL